MYASKDIDRFWNRVDKEHSTIFYNGSRCWEWTAGIGSDGYGHLSVRNKTLGAHRISYELAFGQIQQRLWVLHRCDNRPCVNPSHLFLGTGKDNSDDRDEKGRGKHRSGQDHGNSKLTDEQVAEIRRRYAFWGIGGEDSVTLAKEFGVDSKQIRNIANYKSRR